MIAIAKQESTERCIGRESELSMLKDAYEAASHRGERMVLVRGPAGVGKSWLMAEFRRRMRLDGAVVLEGRCSAGARVLTPLAEILDRAIYFLEEVGLSSEEVVDLDRLAFLLGEQALPTATCAGESLIEKRVQLFEAYCDVLHHLSLVKPPIVMLHDIQWADPLTVELLTYLLDRGLSLSQPFVPGRKMFGVVVASLWSENPNGQLQQLMFHPKVQSLDLTGFDDNGMREYLQSAAVVRRLSEVTGGNPAELEALLQAPATGADEMLRRRVSTLDASARRLLGALAVLGRQSPASMVVEVAGIKSPARSFIELQQSGLIIKSLKRGEITLRMARAHFNDWIYHSLTRDERRELHGRVAELHAEAHGLEVQDLAMHAIRARRGDLAVKAAEEAAVALEVACAYEAAIRLLEEARQLANDTQRVVLSERLARLCHRTGSFAKALEHALVVFEARPHDAEACFMVGRLMVLAGEFERATAMLDKATELASSTARHDLLADLAAARAESLFRCSRFDEALAICDSAAQEAGPARLAIRNVRGKVELSRRRFTRAREAFQDNLTEARAIGEFHLEAQSLTNLGIVFMRELQYERATQCFKTALDRAEQVHDLRESAIALENLGVLAHVRGDLGSALSYYHRAIASLKLLGNRHLQVRAANNLGELYLLVGDTERTQNIIDFTDQIEGEVLPPEVEGEGLLLRARLSLAQSDLAAAQKFLSEAQAIYQSLDDTARLAEINLGFARLEFRRLNVAQAKSLLSSIWCSEGVDQDIRGDAAMLDAEIEASRFGDSLRPILLAVECYDAAGDREKSWRAHLELASILGNRGDDNGRVRHLRKALELERQVRETVPQEFLDFLSKSPERFRLYELEKTLENEPSFPVTRPESFTREPQLPPVSRTAFPPSPAPQAISSIPSMRNKRPSSPPLSTSQLDSIRERYPNIVFRSEEMGQLLSKVERVARSDSQVLIRGESGTGKELIAEVLHKRSGRRDKPIVKVNCAALVESLLLDELFGHEKGAFTGALQQRKGRFELADGGTLFLDEIGDISAKTQVALLRVLQEQVFERVGGTKPIHVDVRLVCATNRDLEALVAEGSFREDLYYRLKGIPIEIPPLRERSEDIEILAQHFLEHTAKGRNERPKKMTTDAVELLKRYSWPGNVRELENVMRSVSLMVDGTTMTRDHLQEHSGIGQRSLSTPTLTLDSGQVDPPEIIKEDKNSSYDEVLDGELTLRQWQKQAEREYIERALGRTGWNITRAAALLGMKRPRLSQLVKEHGLSSQTQDGER